MTLDQIKELKQAIAALEEQRAVLGDAVVDASVSAMREKLQTLETQREQYKQATVLFADVSGFTAMSESMHAEEVSEVMNALWARLDTVISEHGGRVDSHAGDNVMALWGVEMAREEDPAQAIRAALAMQEAQAAFREERPFDLVQGKQIDLSVRIGINTGPVRLGELGTVGEYTALGDTVNTASRLEHAAPVGGILISHATYCHVKGVFEMRALEPIQVKGKVERIQVYVVDGIKPRAFRVATRGVEGIETRMIGRDAELERLQDAFYAAVEDQERQVVTISAEAGVGKSRLLHEFDDWAELQAEQFWIFKGRAVQETQNQPFALLRDLFVFRFQIQDSDPVGAVREKMERGVSEALGGGEQSQVRAHFVGQLLGFDFADSPHLQSALDDARQIHDRALIYLADYFKALAAQAPVLILLEDVHWADESSLDALNHLALALSEQPVLLVCSARPLLFERRPHWGEGQAFHTHLELRSLSRRNSRRLVEDILQKIPQVPKDLCKQVVDAAEGNPFYMEELVKMLIEKGIIVKGQDHWRVEMARLISLPIPPTLTGILQVRLDSLPRAGQIVMQHTAVIGQIFWEDAVEFCSAQELGAVLDVDETTLSPLVNVLAEHFTAGELRQLCADLDVGYDSLVDDQAGSQKDRAARPYLKELRMRLVEYFDKEELRTFCFDLGVEYDTLRGDGKEGKARELISRLERRGRIGELLKDARARRPHILWPDAASAPPEQPPPDRARALVGHAERYNRIPELARSVRRLRPDVSWDDARVSGKILALLRQREYIFRRETSAFAGTREYIFKHDMLRKVVYESVLLRERRVYHARVAEWLIAHSGERADEHVGLVAEHLERAGQVERAVTRLAHAGERAAARYANAEALAHLSRALDLLARVEREPEWLRQRRYELLLGREGIYGLLGQREEQAADLVSLIILADEMDDDRRRIEIARRQADYYRGISDFPTARMAAWKAVHWARRAADPGQEIKALVEWGSAFWLQGIYAEADERLREALALARQHSDRRGEASSLHNLGTVQYFLGDLYGARDFLEQALVICRDVGDRRGEAVSLRNLVAVYDGLGDLVQGQLCSEQALKLYESIGDQVGEAYASNNLANIHRALGNSVIARDYYVRAQKLFQAINDRRGEALTLKNLSLVLHDLGEYSTARRHCERALAIEQDIGNRKGEGYSLTYLALALEGLGELEAAATAYEDALRLRRELGQAALAIDDLAGLARVALKQGQVAQALDHAEEALAWIAVHGVQGIEYPLRVYLSADDVLTEAGQAERAAEVRAAARALVEERATRIGDEATRRGFLENVPLHLQLEERVSQRG